MTGTDKNSHVERLWTAPDGTICMLVTGDAPPRYAVTLVRNERVVRERRLYGRASAEMVAEGWSESTKHTELAVQGAGISSGDGMKLCR